MESKLCKGSLCNGKELPLTEFSPKKNVCKKCHCNDLKGWFKLHDRPHRKYKNEIKQKSSCVKCGCSDIRLLEFDHVKEKSFSICRSFSKKAIEKELQNIQVLCIWCHRVKTRSQMDSVKSKTDEKYNSIHRPINSEEGRKCTGELCKGLLQFKTEFYETVRQSICKVCHSYNSRIRREINFRYVNELKLSLKECELCKRSVTESTTCCFDFDHLHDKKCEIADFTRKNKDLRNEILEESKKCRLLCCNCHRIVTATDLKYVYPKECVQTFLETPPS